jgi:DNA-binding GntR family transcriptional regulator
LTEQLPSALPSIAAALYVQRKEGELTKITKSDDAGASETSTSPDKLNKMVVQALRSEILTGIYPVGTPLPSEAQLVARFSVSRHTVREALRQLRDLGLVESRQGFGTTVTQSSSGGQHYVHRVDSISDLHDYGVESDYSAETTQIMKAEGALAARLEDDSGGSWLRIEGLRFAPAQKTPLCEVEIYVASRFAGVGRLLGRRAGPVYALIEAVYGERIGEVEQTVRALKLDANEPTRLEVEPGETLIEIRRTYRLLDGSVAEITFNRYPADRFSMSMNLKRVRG